LQNLDLKSFFQNSKYFGTTGGNYLISLDAKTGKEAWRFGTIPFSPNDLRDPKDSTPRLICPHAGGVKPWFPTAINPKAVANSKKMSAQATVVLQSKR